MEVTNEVVKAFVDLGTLKSLWFNTGTLCNLECKNCYIESSPKNDQLSYLTVEDILPYLIEIREDQRPTELIGLTGGEPFLNPHIIEIIELILKHSFELLILTNANRVLKKHREKLLAFKDSYGKSLHIRVSLDHYTAQIHDQERGTGAFLKTIDELNWLSQNNFNISIAGRMLKNEHSDIVLTKFQKLFTENEIEIDIINKFVLFPEMDINKNAPQITTACWEVVGVRPEDQMCASERMIVKKKDNSNTTVMPCTLLAYDDKFDLGHTLKESKTRVTLDHHFCAQFCVLGGASCSSTK